MTECSYCFKTVDVEGGMCPDCCVLVGGKQEPDIKPDLWLQVQIMEATQQKLVAALDHLTDLITTTSGDTALQRLYQWSKEWQRVRRSIPYKRAP